MGQCFLCQVENCQFCSDNNVCSHCHAGFDQVAVDTPTLTNQCVVCL